MGIMLVYDISNARSFDNIAKWLRNIDEVGLGSEGWVEISKMGFEIATHLKTDFLLTHPLSIAARLRGRGEDAAGQ